MKNPQVCNGYGGIQYKCYEGGLIKMLVVELVSAAYKPKNSVPNFPKETENIGFASYKSSCQAAANQSVFSLNPETGKKNGGPPAVVELNQDYGMSDTYYSTQSMSTHTGRRSRRSGHSKSRRNRHRTSTSSRNSYSTGFSSNSSRYNNTAGTRSGYSGLDEISTFQGSYANEGTITSRGLDHGSLRDDGRSNRDSRRDRDRGSSWDRSHSSRNTRHRANNNYLARPRSTTTESASNNVIMDDVSEEDPHADGNDWYME
jgi:hypothetical protein